MTRVVELWNRQSTRSIGTEVGNVTLGSYSNENVYLGPIQQNGSRIAFIYPSNGTVVSGLATRIEPFGSEGVEQPHLRLTVDESQGPDKWLTIINAIRDLYGKDIHIS